MESVRLGQQANEQDLLEFKHPWFGDTVISREIISTVGQKKAFYVHQFMYKKVEAIKKRNEVIDSNINKPDLNKEQSEKLAAYIEATKLLESEVDTLNAHFAAAELCAKAAELVILKSEVILFAEEIQHDLKELLETLITFAQQADDLGLIHENGLDTEIRASQLKAFKPTFDNLWIYLQKITSENSK